MAKDCWDKVEIMGKFLGAVLIPSAIAFSVYSFNTRASERATAAQMAGIAVGILMEDPSGNPPSSGALRDWAVDVLKNPGEVTPLGSAAAAQLKLQGLPKFYVGNADQIARIFRKLEDLSEADKGK